MPPPDDVRSIRALAHPLRLRMLDLLRFDGPSTATLLGRRVGESSGSTSYHLRQLAHYGYVEDAGPRGGRERWWRYRERRLTLPDEGGGDARRLVAELLTREAHALDRYLAAPSKPAEWDEAAFFRSAALRLTPGELNALRRADADDAPAGTLPVRILAFGFPLPNDDA